jgi:hypothetical protein
MNLIKTNLTGKVDYNNSIKRAFFYANCAAGAQIFRDNSLTIIWPLDNTLTASFIHRAINDALLATFSWLAQLLVQNSYPMSKISMFIQFNT